jgi:phosphoglycerol transferase MdoB-like AlkP superfamily enzyme
VAYTDSCLGVFISDLKKSKWWDNTLVILLPDHAYKHPSTLKNSDEERHRIPMIWIGGALNKTMKVDRLSSQIDLSKTLLKQLGIDASEYIFSKNIFGKDAPEFAFYAFNDGFGLITPKGISIYDCGASVPLREDDPSLTLDGKAYLQSLFDDLNKR